jgi:inosine/xanthosine triphosphatase
VQLLIVPKIVVASRNPVKINAVQAGFQKFFPQQKWEVKGIAVDSNVSHQPMGDAETLHGAETRARNARSIEPSADYWVGIEGGVEERDGVLHGFAWIVVFSADREGRSRTASFEIPPAIAEMVRDGIELGIADDRFFGRENSKHNDGTVGKLTGDIIDRTALYVPSVVLALVPFRNPEFYPQNDPASGKSAH